MKTAKILSALFVCSTLMMTACTPKDEKILTDAERSKINPRFSKSKSVKEAALKNPPNNQSKKYQFGSYPLIATMLDKQGEALEVIRLALGQQDVATTQFTKSAPEKKDAGYTTKLSMNKAVLNYSTNKGSFKNVVTRNWDVTVTMDGDLVESVVAESESAFNSLDRLNTTDYANLKEKKGTVSLVRTEAGNYELTLKSEGELSARLNGQEAFENYVYETSATIEAVELEKSVIKVSEAKGKSSFIKEGKNPYVVNFVANNLTYNLKGLCNSTEAAVAIKAGRFTNDLVMNESGVVVNPVQHTRFSTTLGACGSRPAIDLSRFWLN